VVQASSSCFGTGMNTATGLLRTQKNLAALDPILSEGGRVRNSQTNATHQQHRGSRPLALVEGMANLVARRQNAREFVAGVGHHLDGLDIARRLDLLGWVFRDPLALDRERKKQPQYGKLLRAGRWRQLRVERKSSKSSTPTSARYFSPACPQ
jgi:hypothetical protein